VNHKRVLRIIREDNLLAVQPRAFVVTTDSNHEFDVYLNLASRMKLTGMNQLWIAPSQGFIFPWAEGWGAPQTLNSKCANSKLSQQRGSPQSPCAKTVPESDVFMPLGLALRKADSPNY
jgi:hypothetical protein